MSKKDKIIEIIIMLWWYALMAIALFADNISVLIFSGIFFLYSAMKLTLYKWKEDSDDKGR